MTKTDALVIQLVKHWDHLCEQQHCQCDEHLQAIINELRRQIAYCPACGSTDGSLGTSEAYFICKPCGKERYWTDNHEHPGDWSVAIEKSPHGRKDEAIRMLRRQLLVAEGFIENGPMKRAYHDLIALEGRKSSRVDS